MNTQAQKTSIKTIDINAYQWFDKVNGNSYFAGIITINYGMDDVRTYKMPFQYGYGDQYKHEAFNILEQNNEIVLEHYPNGAREPLHIFCSKNNIITRYSKQENCKKSFLTNL